MRHVRPSLLITVLSLALVLVRCELTKDEALSDADAAASDTAPSDSEGSDAEESDAAGGGDTEGASDAPAGPDVATVPVPCAVLAGRWQVTLCDANAVPVEFLATGCSFLMASADPTFETGTGLLVDGRTLLLSLPGGVHGPLQCSATMSSALFAGHCENATAPCDIAGVKSW